MAERNTNIAFDFEVFNLAKLMFENHTFELGHVGQTYKTPELIRT